MLFSIHSLRRHLGWSLLILALPLLDSLPALATPKAEPAKSSLEFIRNKGQWDERVRYAAPLPAGRLFVQATAFTYAFVTPEALQHHHGAGAPATRPAGPEPGMAAHAYTVHFEKANAKALLTAETPTTEVRNYFVGNDEKHWASQVPSFRRLRYAQLWPGIALTLYENAGRHLEYDFELAAHANPARVALRYEGADHLSLDAGGNLVVKTSVNTVTELRPQAWQTSAGGQRQPVSCRYVLTGTTVTFALGAYDRQRPLTIDPTVIFSSYTGSTADNWGFTATYDQLGNMYSGGIAFAMGYPTTLGAFQTAFGGQFDIALIKYNTQASGAAARVWATYLGGRSSEFPHSLVVNAAGELVVLGSTSSNNYPTTSAALGRSFHGGPRIDPFLDGAPYDMPNGADLVVTRLSAAGNALRASTYLGGSASDGVQTLFAGTSTVPAIQLVRNYGDNFRGDVLLDATGNVLVASNTASSDFPGLSGALRGGASDALVCKLSPDLSTVLWTVLLGGSGADAAYSVQLDAQQRVYVSGGTTSGNFPTTSGAYLPTAPGGVDGFVARIAASGATIERASYIGTAAYDQSYFVQLDAAGSAYLLGQTLGSFPVTPGLYNVPGGHQFVQKLTPDLTASAYSTVFGKAGGSTIDLVPTAFLVDDCERVYVCGWGGNVNQQRLALAGDPPGLPSGPLLFLGGNTLGLPTPGGLQTTSDGNDFYLAEFTPGMSRLDYATYFGENGGREHVDGGTSRFDKRGIVYQAVCASCGGNQGFPIPPAANYYTTTNGSLNCNNAAFKMDFQPAVADPGPRRFVCLGGGPALLGGSPAGGTWTGPGVRARAGGGYEFDPVAVGAGQYILTYTVATTGVCQATLRVRYVVAPTVVPVLAPLPPQCLTGAAVPLLGTPSGGSWSGPGVSGSTFNSNAGPGTHTLTYTVNDSLGCGTNTMQVMVSAAPTVAAGRDTTLCADLTQPFQLRGFSPAGGTWSGTGVTPSGFFTPPNTNNRGGIFTLTYTLRQPPCVATDTRDVVLAPASNTDVGLNLPVCDAAPQYNGLAPFDCPLTPILITPTATYHWDFGDGSTSTEASPTHHYAGHGSYRIRLTARYENCEVITQFAPLEVGEVFVPNIITPNNDTERLNETFRPRFSCQPASLKVFSRWGQPVFQTDAYHNDWRAEGLAAGLYYYLLKDSTGRTIKGWVEVVK
jgi:hypothetical protein